MTRAGINGIAIAQDGVNLLGQNINCIVPSLAAALFIFIMFSGQCAAWHGQTADRGVVSCLTFTLAGKKIKITYFAI